MMRHRRIEQPALFYEFSLERHVPADHLLRSIDRFVELDDLLRLQLKVCCCRSLRLPGFLGGNGLPAFLELLGNVCWSIDRRASSTAMRLPRRPRGLGARPCPWNRRVVSAFLMRSRLGITMSKYEQYLKNAEDAQRQADRASGDRRAAWLRLVQGWLSLLPRRKQTAAEAFNAKVVERGTGQKNSDAAH